MAAQELATKILVDKIVLSDEDDKHVHDYPTRFIDGYMAAEIGAITKAYEISNRLNSRFTEYTCNQELICVTWSPIPSMVISPYRLIYFCLKAATGLSLI